MPLEIRRILFSDSELYRAVENYRQANLVGFPDGKLVACRPVSPGGLELTLRSRDVARQTCSCAVSSTETMRIVIQFCSDNKIPLPRRGEKCLQVEGDRLCLMIKLDTSLLRQAVQPRPNVRRLA